MKKLGAVAALLFVLTACGDFKFLPDPETEPATHRGTLTNELGERFELSAWFTPADNPLKVDLRWGEESFARMDCRLNPAGNELDCGYSGTDLAGVERVPGFGRFTGAWSAGTWIGTYEIRSWDETDPNPVSSGTFNVMPVAD